MKWSIRIGNLFGIPLYLHVTFFLFLAWVGVESWRVGGGASSAIENLLFICTLFACVVLHELGHALTARRYGIATRDITLLPIGGVARLERMPDDPKQELWVALAGPAVNLVIAAVAVLVIQVTSAAFLLRDGWLDTMFSASFMSRVLIANIILMLFNLIPAFPMDGGRVLRALLATRMDYARATQIAATVGQLMALVFVVLGLKPDGNPMLVFIALFVWIGAAQEAGMAQMRHSLSGIPVSRAMMTEFHTLQPDHTLADAIELTLKSNQRDFPVMVGEHVAGMLRQSDMLATVARQGAQVRVGDVMQTDFQVVQSSEMLDAAFRRLSEHRCNTAPVSSQGRLVGMMTMDNIGDFLAIQGALDKPHRRA